MTSNIVLSASTISMLMLLAKATLILVAALGITLTMQRASAGARHLVWLVTLATLLLVPALTAWGPGRLRVLPSTETLTNNEERVSPVQPLVAPEPTVAAPAPSSPSTTYSLL